ncbi:MAG: hypothetical protein LCH69_19825 [Proteobacteria bacterium]|nr:hypothetical protein [Pseudomonadota bacterium]
MRRAFAIGATSAVSGLAGVSAGAEGLVVSCGGQHVDYSESTTAIGGVERTVSIQDSSEEDGSFRVRISPVTGLSREQALTQAFMQTDIACMQLDARPVPAKFIEHSGDAWVFASGCEGHWVRMEDKCP